MSKVKSLSTGLLISLLLLSAPFSQTVHAEEIAVKNQSPVCSLVKCSNASFQSDLQTRNSGETIAGLFRLVWRFITRG